jgi:hypothetical protein
MMYVPNAVQVSRASGDRLFEAWTDPQKLMHWWRQAGEA